MAAVISIVDDDKAVRDALQRMLQAHGFTTAGFASAEELLASDTHRRTGCLILDVRMPEMTGLELHDHLLAGGSNIPTIFITARPSGGERDRALAAGAVSYLPKPLSEELLLDNVRRALDDGAPAPAASQTC